jgi:hypothetical protein
MLKKMTEPSRMETTFAPKSLEKKENWKSDLVSCPKSKATPLVLMYFFNLVGFVLQ